MLKFLPPISCSGHIDVFSFIDNYSILSVRMI